MIKIRLIIWWVNLNDKQLLILELVMKRQVSKLILIIRISFFLTDPFTKFTNIKKIYPLIKNGFQNLKYDSLVDILDQVKIKEPGIPSVSQIDMIQFAKTS